MLWRKMVGDKVKWCGERWCVTKWCVKDGMVKDGMLKMVCEKWRMKVC